MNGKPLIKKDKDLIEKLRRTGHSFPEIASILNRSKSLVFRYGSRVEVLSQYQASLKSKQGGSKLRSLKDWEIARGLVGGFNINIGRQERILIATMLYWGEGAKKDFSLSNTDPSLIKVFVECLRELGISERDLLITIRIYEDMDSNFVVKFWSKLLNISPSDIRNIYVLKGKKEGKLKYGMCRVRVRKPSIHLKTLQSMIDFVRNKFEGASTPP